MANLIQAITIDSLNALLFRELGETRETIPAGYSELQYALLLESLSDLSFERLKDYQCGDNITICLDLRNRILRWTGTIVR